MTVDKKDWFGLVVGWYLGEMGMPLCLRSWKRDGSSGGRCMGKRRALFYDDGEMDHVVVGITTYMKLTVPDSVCYVGLTKM